MADTSKDVYCEECSSVLKRDWGAGSIGVKTSDGYKT
jgi:predicted nucleic acid-binding Zn ribbon protein